MAGINRRKCCCAGICPNCATDVDSYTVTFVDVQFCSGCFPTAGGASILMTTTTLNASFCLTRVSRNTVSQACTWAYTENPNTTVAGTFYSASTTCTGASVAILPKFTILISRALGGQASLQWLGDLLTGDTPNANPTTHPTYRIWEQSVSATSSPCFPTDWTHPESACSWALVGAGPGYSVKIGYNGTAVITPNC